MSASSCSGSNAAKLIFACSGAADVGAVADLSARKLTQLGAGKMFCTVGLGGQVEPILQTTGKADRILAVDGCGMDCVRHSLEKAGFEKFSHLRITDMGLEKGKTPVDDESVEKVVQRAQELLKS